MKTERGSASLNMTLKDGNIVINRGTDKVELARLDNAPDGTWNAMWDAFETLGIKRRY